MSVKGMPLTKEEVKKLVELIAASPVVFSKATNASNNQLKEAAWSKIADHFNSIVASCPRKPEQLRLKWENLKKAARKRSSMIRMNRLKTGGGKPEYIPPDDTLDAVAGLLVGPTCDGYNVSFGGDAIISDVLVEEVVPEVVEEPTVVMVPFNMEATPISSPSTPQPKKMFFSGTKSKGKLKRQILNEDLKQSIIDRNKSIARYYDLKSRKLELEVLQMEKNCASLPKKIFNVSQAL